MKKNFYNLVLVVVVILMAQLNGFAQPLQLGSKMPLHIYQSGKNNTSFRNSTTANANRTSSCSNDSIVLTRQSQIDSFPVTNQGCTILRRLRIDGTNANPAITRLDSLKYITSITEEFFISHTSVTDLSVLSGITSLGYFFWIDHNGLMTNVVLPNLTQVGDIILDSLPNLTSIAGLTTKTNHDLGTIILSGTGLRDLMGLENMKTVPNMYISVNQHLISLQGLQNLVKCDGGLSIYGNDSLNNLTALSQITGLADGTLEVSYNHQLKNLTGLGNITTIGRGLWINGNGNLSSLADLNPNLVIQNKYYDYNNHYDSLRIQYNPQLALCSFPPVCNYLDTSSAAYINDNAPGCNNKDEIKATCELCHSVTLKTWAGTGSDDWNNASNWLPAGVPGYCDSVVVKSGVTPRPKLTSNAVVHALTMETNTELFMNSFGLRVKGDVDMNTVLVGGGSFFSAEGAKNISIQNCNLFIDSVNLKGYKGSLNLLANTIKGVNSNCNVTLADNSTRMGENVIYKNHIYGNLTITANAVNSLAVTKVGLDGDGQGEEVFGNVTFTVNAPVDFNVGNWGGDGDGGSLKVAGNLNIKSNFRGYPQLNYIDIISGAGADSRITQLGTNPVSIDNLYTDKADGYIDLDQNVFITQRMHFNFGVIKSAANKLLVFNNNAGINQTSSASYVWGPVKKIGNQNFLFPLGDSIYRGSCRVSSAASSLDEFTAQYFYTNPVAKGYDTSLHEKSLTKISGKEYWKIDFTKGNVAARENATGPALPVQVTLSYDSTHSEPVSSIYSLRVARWNGTQWENRGGGGVSGDRQLAFVTSAGPETNFGIFTLGAVPYHLPVITVGKTDSVHCANQLLRIPFSVDSLLFTNNQFIAQLSDSTGSFAQPVNIGYSKTNVNYSDTINAYYLPYNPSSSAIYKIRVIGNSPYDTSINTQNLKIKTVPILQFKILGPNPGCINTGPAKYYTSLKEADTTTKYTWEISGGGGTIVSTHADTAFVNWTVPGRGFLGARSSNSCGTGQYNSVEIAVSQPAPTAAPMLTNTGRWLYASTPLAGQYTAGYRLYRNDLLIDSSNNGAYYASAAGSYKMKYYTLCGDGPASNTISFAAASVRQTITVSPVPNKTYGDSAFAIPATSSSGLPVSYTIVSGPGSIPGNIYNITGTGLVTIRATQPGDNTYDTAAPVQFSFTVNKAPQTITFPAISDKDYSAPSFDLAVSSSSGLPVLDSVVSGNATLNGNMVKITGAGTVTIRAYQLGDTNYLAAAPVTRSFCIKVSSLNPISGPVTICPGVSATYAVNNIAGSSYTWRISGGNKLSSDSSSVTVIWPSPGKYLLTVSAAGSCGLASKIDSLFVTAITSVKPDSVQNMLPANGAINQQLPLTLSWIPKNPNLFYTYDLYLWRADSARPSSPYVAGLTSVNYTIPLYSGLSYNTAYKWMVVAHNGSCTVLTTGPVQQFTLIPLPDLQVYNVTAPVSAFSGQSVSVTWKVKNNGPGNTQQNQQWTDAIYIAKDSVLDFTNPAGQLAFPVVPLLVVTKPNVSALNAGELYSDTATFTLPRDYSGPLYMHVVTNYAPPAVNPVIEITKANDTSHALPATTVALSPTADLRIDSIINPGNTFSGSTINVQAKIKNYGVNAAGQWIDKVYLSKDPLFNISNALLLQIPNGAGSYAGLQNAFFTHLSGLQHDSTYTANFPVVIPNFIYGNYYVYVITNANADLYEGASQNNNTAHGNALQIFLTPTPKLTPTFPYTVYNFSTTQQVVIGWQIQNQGAYDNIQKNIFPDGRNGSSWGYSEWDDKAYISMDSTGLNKSTAYYVGNYHERQIILPQSSYYGNVNWSVPDNFPPGKYYMYLQSNVNKSVFEYPGTQLTARSNSFSILRSDLTVPSVSVTATGNSGQLVAVNYSLLNIGAGGVYNHYRKDYIYLGNSHTFDSTAQVIDSAVYSSASVAANVLQPLQKQTMLPNGISGSKYIFVKTNADSSFKEDNLNNNTNTEGAPVTIALTPNPDLQVTGVNLSNTVYSSVGFPFKYTVGNAGSGIASGTWKDSIFISCNSSFIPASSYFVGVRTEKDYVPASGSYSDSFSLVVPFTFLINNTGCLNKDTSQVYFFVKTNADNGVYEAGLNKNNISGSGQVTLINSLVDHIVTNVSSGDSALVGRYFKVNWTVKNVGLNPNDYTYSYWRDGLYLSPDSVFNSNASLIGSKGINQRLNHLQAYSDSLSCYVPNLTSGYYYLFGGTNLYNEVIAERNLTNNTNLSRNSLNQPVKVYVTNPPAPDLVNTIVSAPANTAVGQPVTIIYKITNNGVGPTYPSTWTDDIWLSNSFQPGGLLLSRKYHNGILFPGQSYTDSITATIPINQPQGNYAFVIFTNQDRVVYESDFTNNTSYQYVSVYTPPPVDLIVNNISTTDTVTLGYSASVKYLLSNISSNTANGTETDGIYISSDSTTNTTNDILIGTKANQLNLLPLNSTDINSNPVITGVMEGTYFVKVKADILNNILETNKQNNTGVINHKVFVKIKNLPVSVVTPDSLSQNYLYYKLVIPTALKGKTISVKLTSNDSLTANNQLYIGLGYLPSAAHFDYAYGAPNAGNQQIVIESVADSVYYIALKGAVSVRSYQLIRLQAVELPFAILSVNASHGGNTGNVTVQVKGSLFSNNMTAKIIGISQSNTITASKVYFVNGATVYATFNLRGAPSGVYNVTLQKPDAWATLPSSFTVEQANNGGLITGNGTNNGQTGSGNEPGCDPGAPAGLNSQLQTEIIIPPKVFASWPFTIQINHTNASNVDVPVQVKILYSLDGAPISLTEAGLAEGKTSLYIEFKDAAGPPGIIRAGGSGTIKVYSKAPTNAAAHSHLNYNLK